ncbi:PTS glucitol/sorbitol transporter subunit IIA [Melissococcus plutonius]|uniref:PTS system, glucitol/sorbitol-specific IIA component n=1 Tax=Melissococcus plutonius (strain ATCC 35311 / DSM 29964 / CIP 104052 / LMG 20360 / NCIMB 702443) TaxID=940190 RepID=F3YBW0_MELPT|nr:PTS glucitol/sorbitol transporter subunit IIA [Melissococcus plutonius]AIM25257.1 PTS system, glucitol/sorbitol-specific IIA component [Melissococcus plutonius S1]KMT23939.1 PTS system, glucitol/sorbitol-specific IIA component [Melissococcus plutonius]KMT24462.1 PTS system, glucitol/sorbitol-specific IIA component [Melissococcus plutonius]KMT26035.1 PTS system, glucitol/sorbitol-specific IIA component [Melissococcus plutonius]KMT28584.1 PTS system, glucitol/sorbitol-specific IIA component [
MQALVTEIGKYALTEDEPMIILFGETATQTLREYSVIQKFKEPVQPIILKPGDFIRINQKKYTICYVGPIANENLSSISHVTLVFDKTPESEENAIANGLYLSPYELPTLSIGSIIEYENENVNPVE